MLISPEFMVPVAQASQWAIERTRMLYDRIQSGREIQGMLGRAAIAMSAISISALAPTASAPPERPAAAECFLPDCKPSVNEALGLPPGINIPNIVVNDTAEVRPKIEKTKFVLPSEYRIAEKRIDAVQLTVEDFAEFAVSGIDKSYLPFAQKFTAFDPPEFNKGQIRIRQGETKILMDHFSVSTPASIVDFIISMDRAASKKPKWDKRLPTEDAERAVQFVIFNDPKATVYQLTDDDAKVAHAFTFNEYTVGKEIIARDQNDATTAQYKKSLLLTTWLIIKKNLLDDPPDDPEEIEEVYQGHGEAVHEKRQQWNATHAQKMGVRNDFNEPVMDYLRETKLYPYLRENWDLLVEIVELHEAGLLKAKLAELEDD